MSSVVGGLEQMGSLGSTPAELHTFTQVEEPPFFLMLNKLFLQPRRQPFKTLHHAQHLYHTKLFFDYALYK